MSKKKSKINKQQIDVGINMYVRDDQRSIKALFLICVLVL